MKKYSDRYMALMGMAPGKIPHWEHWSCPDAETYLTGIDYYKNPRLCRERMLELYPELELPVPPTNEPKPRPEDQQDKTKGRWGDAYRDHWQQDDAALCFTSVEDVLEFSPLRNIKMLNRIHGLLKGIDLKSEETIFKTYRHQYPEEWGDKAPEGSTASANLYQTLFMWPLMVFGYENFLSACLEPAFERIMDEFAEVSRRIFKALARLPVNFIVSHDDIMLTSGPVCSPLWMRKHIFPRYEEFWGIVKDAGKEVIFMVDGNIDVFADDIMALGARGIITEPFADFKAIAAKHKDCFLAGEGDNRILMRDNPLEIRKMVLDMVETAKITGGYMMCIGNHIPWNVPPEAVKRYLDLSRELACR